MKHIILFILLTFFSFAGFFNETYEADKAEYIENERLCKLFKKKVEQYKNKMREDVLAQASLESYKYRAELFCKEAKTFKKDINTSIIDSNTTEQNITK